MMPKIPIKHVFFDLDHTLWDFETNSFAALQLLFESVQLDVKLQVTFELFHLRYSVHNHYFWKEYSKGLISQSELRWKRMFTTLVEFGLDDKKHAKQLGEMYLELLPTCNQLFPYALELLTYLKSKSYSLHILSNGFEQVQHQKLTFSGIKPFFDQIITSDKIQYAKPHRKIFDFALEVTKAHLTESIMIGDNPEVDLQGALNAGMQSVYMDHLDRPTTIHHTYRVNHLQEIQKIL